MRNDRVFWTANSKLLISLMPYMFSIMHDYVFGKLLKSKFNLQFSSDNLSGFTFILSRFKFIQFKFYSINKVTNTVRNTVQTEWRKYRNQSIDSQCSYWWERWTWEVLHDFTGIIVTATSYPVNVIKDNLENIFWNFIQILELLVWIHSSNAFMFDLSLSSE